MLTVVAELVARPGREAEVRQELLAMVEATPHLQAFGAKAHGLLAQLPRVLTYTRIA